jgi:hypothetical protein
MTAATWTDATRANREHRRQISDSHAARHRVNGGTMLGNGSACSCGSNHRLPLDRRSERLHTRPQHLPGSHSMAASNAGETGEVAVGKHPYGIAPCVPERPRVRKSRQVGMHGTDYCASGMR